MLIEEATKIMINTTEISRGSLIWAQHQTWDEGVSGIVENADEHEITVRYLPSKQNVQNHFIIYAAELSAGAWKVRYSSDGLETVSSYGISTDTTEAGDSSGS